MTMKTKAFAFKVKAADDEGVIEGYASVFGVRDSYNEIVMPGAFAKSLARHQREGTYPLMLWQHNPDEPIGVWLEMNDDGKGLYVKGKLLRGVRRADEALIMLKNSAVQGMSIGYREIDVDPSSNGEARKLNELELYEASVVSFPANRRARVETVKQILLDGNLPSMPEFEKYLREAGFSKTQAAAIASRGLSHLLRSESVSDQANDAAALLRALRG